jgi:hypothetical protein
MATAPKNDAIITLTINGRGTLTKDFPKTAKISEVIEAARIAFNLAAGDRFELVVASNPNEILEPQRTIVSYHLTDGTVLTLTWIGSGV